MKQTVAYTVAYLVGGFEDYLKTNHPSLRGGTVRPVFQEAA